MPKTPASHAIFRPQGHDKSVSWKAQCMTRAEFYPKKSKIC